MKQIRKRITYANVMSSIAIFLILGGATAIAAGLAKNSVGTKQLKKNAVSAAKLKRDAVTSAKVKDGSLLGGDFAAGQLPAGPKGDRGDVGPTFGRSDDGGCNPSSSTFVTCASTGAISLPTAGRVLLVGASSWDNNGDAAPNEGNCQLTVDGTPVGTGPIDLGEDTTTHGIGTGGSVALTAISDVLPAGNHTFSLECNEDVADVFFTDSTLSAVLLGGS